MDALTVVITGLVLLAALAWIIGRVEANARNGAWERIADARRDLHYREQQLHGCLGGPRCEECPLHPHVNDGRAN